MQYIGILFNWNNWANFEVIFNSIELPPRLWSYIEMRVKKRKPKDLEELMRFVEQELDSLSRNGFIHGLFLSLFLNGSYKRVILIIRAYSGFDI